jgi:hypothetical protein
MVFNTSFNNISGISWRSGLLVHDRMVVGFNSNYLCNQCLSPLKLWVRTLLRRGVLDTILCDKVCQWLAADRWFSPCLSRVTCLVHFVLSIQFVKCFVLSKINNIKKIELLYLVDITTSWHWQCKHFYLEFIT